MLDSTVVTLALPAIQESLGASSSELQWMATSYLLVIGALVVPAGRLGDLRGGRPVFCWGLAIFGAGALIGALAGDPLVLILARVVQGIGAAAMLALSLALASAAFPEAERPRALGIWAGVSAAALALGPLLGGVLVEALSWRWIFWWVLPLVVLGGLLIMRASPGAGPAEPRQRLDLVGTVTIALGLSLVILSLVQGREWGWSSPAIIGSAALGVVMLIWFWLAEHRVEAPIFEFALFRNGPYFGASAAAFTLVGCWWVVIYYQPQYLQNVLGYSAVEAGLLILPITLPMAVLSPAAGSLIGRFGARGLMTVGMACGVAGLLFLTAITSTSGYATLLPGYLLFGIALSLVYAPMSNAAMAAMPDDRAGIAAGVLAMNRVVAGALTLGVIGAIYQHLDAAAILAGESAREAVSSALARSSWALVGLCALGAILTWGFVRSAPRDRPSDVAHRSRFHL